MLLSGDVKGLEVVACAYLSQDDVLCQEVREGRDFHEDNRVRFKFPGDQKTGRTTAKRFKFKLIYGGSAYGYANDSDFINVGFSQAEWQRVIDEYYLKYSGVSKWHTHLVREAIALGVYKSPSGRVYSYPSAEISRRIWFWRPKILNYPVQGLGADLVMLARITFWKRLLNSDYAGRVRLISSVHDSIVVDVDGDLEMCYNVGRILRKSIQDVPINFRRVFGVEFNLPMDAEIKIGKDLFHMEKIEC